MLQAWIASPWGSLYFAAEATRCNLQQLRDHLRGMRRFKAEDLRLSLTLADDDDDAVAAEVSELADDLAARGAHVTISTANSRCGAKTARSSRSDLAAATSPAWRG